MPLIDYLPSVVEDTEIKMVLEAIEPILTAVFKTAERVLDNQFILDMDEFGAGRWERNLKITTKSDSTSKANEDP